MKEDLSILETVYPPLGKQRTEVSGWMRGKLALITFLYDIRDVTPEYRILLFAFFAAQEKLDLFQPLLFASTRSVLSPS